MARRRKRVTPITKLILFLLFSTPILYLGISYAIGQDGVGNIKSLIGLSKKTENTTKSYTPPPPITEEERDKMYQQIEEMKRQLREKNQEIKQLNEALSSLKATQG